MAVGSGRAGWGCLYTMCLTQDVHWEFSPLIEHCLVGWATIGCLLLQLLSAMAGGGRFCHVLIPLQMLARTVKLLSKHMDTRRLATCSPSMRPLTYDPICLETLTFPRWRSNLSSGFSCPCYPRFHSFRCSVSVTQAWLSVRYESSCSCGIVSWNLANSMVHFPRMSSSTQGTIT